MNKFKNKDGYIILVLPNHPKSFNGKIAEHIVVMETYLGRSLPDGTVVHHKNRIRGDNRIENLLLLRNEDDHLALHRAMKSGNTNIVQAFEEWSIEFMFKLKAGLPEEECFYSNDSGIDESVEINDNKKAEIQNKLFLELKKERKKISDEHQIPAYIVFHDKTLIEMCKIMPDTEESMLQINGVGPYKFLLYGPIFIEIIKKFKNYLNVA